MFKDSRGNQLVPGVRVAYNRSGEVRLGNLVSIAENKHTRDYAARPRYYMQSINPFATIIVKGEDGKVSKLTRITNLVVIG